MNKEVRFIEMLPHFKMIITAEGRSKKCGSFGGWAPRIFFNFGTDQLFSISWDSEQKSGRLTKTAFGAEGGGVDFVVCTTQNYYFLFVCWFSR